MAAQAPKMSDYLHGWRNNLSIRNIPIVMNNYGHTYCVDSTLGGNSGAGDRDNPFATIDYAIGRCTANNGDRIIVMPGHAETLTAAGAITCDVAGVSIIGIGEGADRPEITFGTSTSASIVISAANVTIANIVGIAGIDGLTNPIHIQASNCSIDMEWQDGSSTVEAARAVLTTAAADNLDIKLKYIGFTAGNAVVNAIRLVGCDNGRIFVDFYGVASTSVVEFLTTACTNIMVMGYVYNSGTTNGSKLVVDTATASTWYAEIMDGAAGTKYSGGSGSAIAGDDISTIYNALYGISGAYIPGWGIKVSKSHNIATDNVDLFTVTGKCAIMLLTGEVTTVIATTTTYAMRVKTTNEAIFAATTITTDADGTQYLFGGDPTVVLNNAGTPTTRVAFLDGAGPVSPLIVGNAGGTATIESDLDGAGTGVILWELWYYPLEASASIVAA